MIRMPDHVPNLIRLRVLYGVILLAFGAILFRLWYLQIMHGAALAEQAESQRSRLVRRVAPRGEILDAKGRKLATNRSHFVVAVWPEELKKNPCVLPLLASLLQTSEEELKGVIRKNRDTPFDPVPIAEDASIALITQIEEQKLDLPGVLILKDPTRFYTDKMLATHLLGVVRPISAEKLKEWKHRGYRGSDKIGTEGGVEASYEEALRGREGGQLIEVDARGRIRRTIEEIQPTAGNTLRLTVDKELQRVAYDSLREYLNKGKPGAAVAMDPRDGAVLAMVSLPSYDPNRYGQDYNAFNRDKLRPLWNRAVQGVYPIGSPFKLITAAAGLESGVIRRASRFYCPGYIKKGRWRFHCDKRSGHGSLDLDGAIGKSCNVYFWRVADLVGPKRLADMAFRFGLGKRTGIDLAVEFKGLIPTEEWKKRRWKQDWYPGDTLNMAIGQGFVGATPLQLVNYTAALANGGALLRPQVVREIRDSVSGKVLHRLEREERSRLELSDATQAALHAGMLRVTQRGGTAGGLTIPGIPIAAKTGTAEAIVGGKLVDHSIFTCYAPADNPTIAVSVIVETGGFGASAAAPIARKMLMQHFGLLKPPASPPAKPLPADRLARRNR